jgi:hypothetical protein
MSKTTMEDNNYRTDFELFLRESIEDFKMIPTRKIWHSIYNNMHPDRKWPSITICALILFCVLYVGISNNNSINKATLASKNQLAYNNNNSIVVNEQTNKQNNNYTFGENTDTKQLKATQENTTSLFLNNTDNTSKTTATKNNLLSESNFTNKNKYYESVLSTGLKPLPAKVIVSKNNSLKIEEEPVSQNYQAAVKINYATTKAEINSTNTPNQSYNSGVKKDNTSNASINEVELTPNIERNSSSNYIENKVVTLNTVALNNNQAVFNSKNKVQQASEKNEIDFVTNQKNSTSGKLAATDDLLKKEPAKIKVDGKENTVVVAEQKNKTFTPLLSKAQARKNAIAKFKEKSIISYYITPSYGYRTLNIKQDVSKLYGTNSLSFLQGSNTNSQIHKDVAALNFEAGFNVAHKINKKISLKAGIQANYTNYVSKVTDIGHSTQTSLRTANQQLDNLRSSQYNTNEGDANLNRSNIQISIPIGADLKLLGNEKIKWYIGATLQPTYVLSDNAYVFSGDEKYYISEKSLQRKFNINTAFETYLSIKTKTGVAFNIGPQIRYQLLNSYKKDYNYTEKLYNIGVKIGVSTTF